MSHILFPSPFTRIPHPFAADYGQHPHNLLPSTRQTVERRDSRHSQYASTSSTHDLPHLRFSPRPQRTTRPEPRTRKSTYRPTSSNQLMPIAQPLPLCSPPPPASEEVFPFDPLSSPSPSPSPLPRPRSSSSRLIRPDSRIRRHQKRKSMGVPDLKPLSRNDPEIKGLYPIMEVEEELVGLGDYLPSRLRESEGALSAGSSPSLLAPSPMPFYDSPLYHLPSARASSQLLVPSPIHLDESLDLTDADGDVAMSDEAHSPQQLLTPSVEEEDPFAFDGPCLGSGSRSPELIFQPRSKRDRNHRPAPLILNQSYKNWPAAPHSTHPYAGEGPDLPKDAIQTRRILNSPPLLSPLPIASPGVLTARQRSFSGQPPESISPKANGRFEDGQTEWVHRRACKQEADVDLEFAMEELLATAGERHADIFWLHALTTGSSSSSSSRSSSMVSSESEGEMSDADLFFRQPRGSRSLDTSDLVLAASFPLPPTRSSSLDMERAITPVRPPRAEDMGLSSILHYRDDELLGSPIQISPAVETPRTPENQLMSRFSTPSPVPTRPAKERQGWKPKLSGDHSFLQAMSRGEDAPSDAYRAASPVESLDGGLMSPISQFSSIGSDSSGSSCSSRRSLPRRGGLPDPWRRFGRKI